MTLTSAVSLDHLASMTDGRGLFEHAKGAVRRIEHGYCTDDNARMLVVTSRGEDVGDAARLSRVALGFTAAAQVSDGRVRNRLNAGGRWTDRPTTDDCWGRSLWGFATAARQHDDPVVRDAARVAFDIGVRQRSLWPRSMAFAALGAADVLAIDARHVGARLLIHDAVAFIGAPGPAPWVWPERRLRYANAVLAEATIAGGDALHDRGLLDRGLAMLGWLLARETATGHLSVTGTDGRLPADAGPQFDQQPIEVAAMADACWRAHQLTQDPVWARGVLAAAEWFEGANDSGMVMHDPATGGGFDGLMRDGVNINQGAESTLAWISTMQRAEALRRGRS